MVTGDGGGLGLRSKLVDVVCLGLQLAEESEEAAGEASGVCGEVDGWLDG